MKDSQKNIFIEASVEIDQELLDFYNDQSMDGDIRLSLNRDPSFFSSVAVEGSRGQVVIARSDSDQRVTAVGHISSKPCYVNAQESAVPVGYLSSLRLEEKLRGSFLFIKCFNYLKKVHEKHQFAQIYLTTIMEDNEKAKKILGSKRAGLPHYNDAGLLQSYLLKVGSFKWMQKKQKSSEVRKAKVSDLDSIVHFLNTNGGLQRQFFPQYLKEDFLKPSRLLKDFKFEDDLYLAFSGSEVVGVLGVWNQSQYRRWFVKGYSNRFKIIKPLFNIYAKVFRKPSLPNQGHTFDYSFLSIVCIKGDDPEVFKSLLQKIWDDYKGNKSTVLCIGFHQNDPLKSIIIKHPHLELKSRLYVVHWEDGMIEYSKVDKHKIPYLEFGAL